MPWLPGTAPSAHAASGRTTDTVRLSWSVGALPHFAKARGEFEKSLARDGIKLEWVGPFVGHASSLQALVGGSVDFSFGGSSSVAMSTLLAGSPLLFTLSVDTKPRTTAILTRLDSGIERVEDLVGRTVAVNRSGLGEFLLVAALEKHRIDRSKVKVIFLNPPDAGPAFRAGKIDAWST
jgi:sulfonate transport system substrate-binding protein